MFKNLILHTYFLFYLAFFLLITISCEDEKCGGSSSRYQYMLQADVSMSPALEQYTIGDTVRFSVVIPRMILDRNHDVIETVSEQALEHLSLVKRVDSIEPNILTDLFLDIVRSGAGDPHFEDVGRSVFIAGDYTENVAGDWELNYDFVLKRTGVYFFRLGGFFEGESRAGAISLMNECRNGVTQMFYQLNDGANNNWQLLCEANEIYCTPAWDETVRDRTFDQHAGYIFKVTN